MDLSSGRALLGKIFSEQEVELAKSEVSRLLLEGSGRIICEPEHLMTIRKIMNFCDHSEPLTAMRDTLANKATEIFGKSAKMLADNALLKPPRVGSASRWHQDQAILEIPPDRSVCGFWVALEDADLGNGCMKVYPDSHVTFQHRTDDGWYIPEDKLPPGEPTPLEMRTGEAAVWTGTTIHGSGPNTSDRARWSLQYHFDLQPIPLF
jgi:ectoine hydroxylase-related dioxygenase (phytanoyl-CoA dioxygenase family)